MLNGTRDRETSGFSASCFVTAITDALNRTYGGPRNCLKNLVSSSITSLFFSLQELLLAMIKKQNYSIDILDKLCIRIKCFLGVGYYPTWTLAGCCGPGFPLKQLYNF